MTSLLAPANTLLDSQRLIAAFDHLRNELPLANEILDTHEPLHVKLQQTHQVSEQAVTAWRTALASRWECEVAGRRLYKRILRQLIGLYGEHAPEVQLLSRGGAEADSSPSELLADLRRLGAAFAIGGAPIDTPELQGELQQCCAALDRAIETTRQCETQRRNAVLDHRMAGEVYRRARTATHRKLLAFYSNGLDSSLSELFAD